MRAASDDAVANVKFNAAKTLGAPAGPAHAARRAPPLTRGRRARLAPTRQWPLTRGAPAHRLAGRLAAGARCLRPLRCHRADWLAALTAPADLPPQASSRRCWTRGISRPSARCS